MPFVQTVNPLTGKSELISVISESEEEMILEADQIAASMFADMLLDDARNAKYRQAIEHVMNGFPVDANPLILDIGTGTGLLGMMGARAHPGASVVACELYKPMAMLAPQIVASNNMSDRIVVHHKRSTDLSVGNELPRRADVCTSELLDTELLGEGVLPSIRHALQHLLINNDDNSGPKPEMVPAGATIFAAVVESDMLSKWHSIDDVSITPEISLKSAGLGCLEPCRGAMAAANIQASQLRRGRDFELLTAPFEVFRWDYCSVPSDGAYQSPVIDVPALRDGRAHAVIFWWDLHMARGTDITITTTPSWARDDEPAWRDHWMQALCFLPTSHHFEIGERMIIQGIHDDFSIWFQLEKSIPALQPPAIISEPPLCTCGLHMLWNHQRMWSLNDTKRCTLFSDAITDILTTRDCGDSNDSLRNVLCVSDGSLPAIMAASIGKEHARVTTLEHNSLSNSAVKRLQQSYSLDNLHILKSRAEDIVAADVGGDPIDILLGEPFFYSSILPWHSLYFWFARTTLQPLLAPDVIISPSMGTLYGMIVEFQDLWKNPSDVNIVEGFDLSLFNDVKASPDAHEAVYPMWEYAHKPLSAPFQLAQFNFCELVHDVESSCVVTNEHSGLAHGVVMWMDYSLDAAKSRVASNCPPGPDDSPRPGKQAVKYFRTYKHIDAGTRVNCVTKFSVDTGTVTFNFKIEE